MLQNWQNSNGELIDPNANIEKEIADTDLRLKLSDALQEAIKQLTLKQKQAIASRYFNGLSSAEAAKEIGVGVDTLKSHVRQAHFRLFAILCADPMAKMPAYKTRPLQLHLDGKTYESIARKLGYVGRDGGVNTEAVKTRIRLSKQYLYKVITADGFHALLERD